MKKVNDLSTQKVMTTIVKWGTQIVFLISIVIVAYLSFVDDFKIKPSLKNVSILSAVAAVLNWIVWDSWYTSMYEKSITLDRNNPEYSVHRRYYNARKGWKYNELQDCIRNYNRNFVEQWKADVEDITGRSIADIESGGYRHHDHKRLIRKIKKHAYPKSGIKTPKDMLYVLSVNASDSMKLHIHKAEHYHAFGKFKKAFSSVLSMIFAASIAVSFIKDGLQEAMFTLLLMIAILFSSLFFGAMAGAAGARMKLATCEEICELLEEWKNVPPSEEPFATHQLAVPDDTFAKPQIVALDEPKQDIVKEEGSIIELT